MATYIYINEDEKGHTKAYLSPTNDLAFSGTMASNLVDYNPENLGNYLSGVNPKKNIEITFDLHGNHFVNFIRIYNYFIETEIDLNYSNRGIKKLNIYLDNEVPFDELLNDIAYKFSCAKTFFGDARMALSIEGRELSLDEEKSVIDIIHQETELSIVCLVGKQQEAEKQFK